MQIRALALTEIHVYIRDGLAHLSDENTYKKIDSDPTTMLVNIFTSKGVIDTITKDYLLFLADQMPRMQQIYFHKSSTAVQFLDQLSYNGHKKISL